MYTMSHSESHTLDTNSNSINKAAFFFFFYLSIMAQSKSCALEWTVTDWLCGLCVSQEHLIENEVAVLRRVKHPNIIMLIEEVDTPSELYLVMELVKVRVQAGSCVSVPPVHAFDTMPLCLPSEQGGDLFDAITSSAKYTERDASIMVYNLAGALKYLHSMNIVHRDIKPENLLVNIYTHPLFLLQLLSVTWLSIYVLY